MFDTKLYFIIFIIFLIFIGFQIYFYSIKYKKNENLLNKIESFQTTLKDLDNKNEYILDDKSLEILLEDYNKLKNDIKS